LRGVLIRSSFQTGVGGRIGACEILDSAPDGRRLRSESHTVPRLLGVGDQRSHSYFTLEQKPASKIPAVPAAELPPLPTGVCVLPPEQFEARRRLLCLK